MATMTVWKFPTANGAAIAEDTLKTLQRRELIRIHDAAIVTYPEGAKKPKTRQLNSLTGAGALGGAFWGMLFGLIFFVPLLGMAIGAGMGALTGSMSDVGIDDAFIRRMREEIQPGTSALFVLSSGAVVDKVKEAFAGQQMVLIETNLSHEQEDKLREVFSEEEPTPAPTS
ncbi:DUF1269 domain-containing protein [Geodermatophilus sabuli]|uniref:Uncharacterized membrane protein n=1 Tax=Geodermatophilus sabuli TaxID=1564158 RepID=A0A285EEC6_9ACTN|nr:DUF1269 domain-containing protein [Geodermatophilus sabuli]MBB3084455.1 putative membrane protein [Geodermatophilus sabuli]SNX97350.1 Uncharacterized membrane protein [Geodermatophilus sabuli]